METDVLNGSLEKDVYIAFWIKRSSGTIRGATLTLDRRTGGLYIAFLALYVTASGRSLWKLIRCLLHFTFSWRTPPDGIYLQGQITLRNTPLAFDAALGLLEIWRVWRKKAAKTDNRLWLLHWSLCSQLWASLPLVRMTLIWSRASVSQCILDLLSS